MNVQPMGMRVKIARQPEKKRGDLHGRLIQNQFALFQFAEVEDFTYQIEQIPTVLLGDLEQCPILWQQL